MMITQHMCSLNDIYHPHWLVQWSCHCSCMRIPVHSPWLPGYIDAMQNVLVTLTMAGLLPDRPRSNARNQHVIFSVLMLWEYILMSIICCLKLVSQHQMFLICCNRRTWTLAFELMWKVHQLIHYQHTHKKTYPENFVWSLQPHSEECGHPFLDHLIVHLE